MDDTKNKKSYGGNSGGWSSSLSNSAFGSFTQSPNLSLIQPDLKRNIYYLVLQIIFLLIYKISVYGILTQCRVINMTDTII